MIKIFLSKKLTKEMKKLEKRNPKLLDEVLEKIEDFKDPINHKKLRVHKLHGKMKKRYGFWVNYKDRIIFKYKDRVTANLLTFGDHSIYE